MEYQPNNEVFNKAGNTMPTPVLKIAEKMLKEGRTCEETAKIVSVRKQTIVNLRKELEGEGKLDIGGWKKEVAGDIAEFVRRGSARLVNNVDNIPIGQLPMAIAIAIDKVRDLADTPTIKVETRLKISQDELKKAFSLDSEPIDIITNNEQQNEQPTNSNEQGKVGENQDSL